MRVIETPPIAARWMGHPCWIPAFAGMTDVGGRGSETRRSGRCGRRLGVECARQGTARFALAARNEAVAGLLRFKRHD